MASSWSLLLALCIVGCFLLPERVRSLDLEYKDQIPPWLAVSESPLDSAETQKWVDRLATTGSLSQSSRTFCSDAKLQCDSDIPAGGPIMDCSCCCLFCCYTQAAANDIQLFLLPRHLSTGATILLPDLRNPIPSPSFLPDSIAKALLPLSPSQLPRLLQNFGIATNSTMAKAMRSSLQLCTLHSSSPTSDAFCPASLESMLDFVTVKLRTSSFSLLTSDLAPPSVATILSITELNNASDANVVCHKLMFPFELHFCHYLSPTQVFDVELRLVPSDGEHTAHAVIHAIAACHLDTSSWPKENLVLKALGVTPGQSPICHWILNRSLVGTV